MTEKQKKILNSEAWWEDRNKGMQYIKHSSPVTAEEAIEQQKRLDAQLGKKNTFLGSSKSKQKIMELG